MTETDATPQPVIERHEDLYWAVADAFMVRQLGLPTEDDLEAIIEEQLAVFAPEADESQRQFHKVQAIRYILGAVASAGTGPNLAGESLMWHPDASKPDLVRPLRAVTGALAVVMVASSKEELTAMDQLALPLDEQTALESLLQLHFGTSRDSVSVGRFPVQLGDFFQLGIEDLLTHNLVAGAQGNQDADFEQAYRQALLRRQPVTRVWKLADGNFGYVALWPVTVMSMLAADYWEHGTPFGEQLAQPISEILASALAQRELLGTRVDVYCGHLHVGNGLASAVEAIEKDLAVSGAKLLKLPARRNTSQVGRNLPCPCGSGVKFKRCCGAG